MKYILKENINPERVSGVERKIMKAIESGKPFSVTKLPRNLIGKVEEVKEKPKKIMKEID